MGHRPLTLVDGKLPHRGDEMLVPISTCRGVDGTVRGIMSRLLLNAVMSLIFSEHLYEVVCDSFGRPETLRLSF